MAADTTTHSHPTTVSEPRDAAEDIRVALHRLSSSAPEEFFNIANDLRALGCDDAAVPFYEKAIEAGVPRPHTTSRCSTTSVAAPRSRAPGSLRPRRRVTPRVRSWRRRSSRPAVTTTVRRSTTRGRSSSRRPLCGLRASCVASASHRRPTTSSPSPPP
ncbi:hypothetical protein G7085_20360 [Tessaracoccus sp. HDW20]|uniref:hypothetical protein n=1 Tax=Tessaracoccus coleopterorum TaxID=2714950 RepID=UPI0018D41871|nr:hypothetical protein [Tessaracoccus coleopterorum]NHB86082.1 hypothetical protein [Tessaracoccus coleopterorum]